VLASVITVLALVGELVGIRVDIKSKYVSETDIVILTVCCVAWPAWFVATIVTGIIVVEIYPVGVPVRYPLLNSDMPVGNVPESRE
jgi:uncharacterized protein with PQ loop repeat